MAHLLHQRRHYIHTHPVHVRMSATTPWPRGMLPLLSDSPCASCRIHTNPGANICSLISCMSLQQVHRQRLHVLAHHLPLGPHMHFLPPLQLLLLRHEEHHRRRIPLRHPRHKCDGPIASSSFSGTASGFANKPASTASMNAGSSALTFKSFPEPVCGTIHWAIFAAFRSPSRLQVHGTPFIMLPLALRTRSTVLSTDPPPVPTNAPPSSPVMGLPFTFFSIFAGPLVNPKPFEKLAYFLLPSPPPPRTIFLLPWHVSGGGSMQMAAFPTFLLSLHISMKLPPST